jgi:hypothetical protein
MPRYLGERLDPRAIRLPLYKATPVRNMHSLRTCTQLTLRPPHVPSPETGRQLMEPINLTMRAERMVLGFQHVL